MPGRRALSLLVLVVATATGAARASGEPAEKGIFGAGLIVGEPTGVSVKYYLGNDTAIDGAIGAAFLGGGIQVHGDFLWHPFILERADGFVLPFYFGVGLRVLNHDGDGADDDHVRIGARVPVGILFDFTEIPLDVFAEIAGVADYRSRGDSTFGLDINGGAGVRYYF